MPAPTYTAFISYRHGGADGRWARWLHRRLEAYRPPAPHAAGWRGRRLFRDEDELAASADLGAALRAALEASDALIVVCSPRTPESRWVAAEVAQFQEWGRGDRIFPVLIAGTPDVSFPAPLLAPGVPEPLAADARSGRPTDALLRVAAALLNVPFDELRRREDERRRRRLAGLTAVVAVLAAVFLGLAVYAFVQADLAEQRRGQAAQAETREREQREVAEERLARSLLDRGLTDVLGGRPAPGLHSLARAAELAKPDTPLAAEANALLADWGRTLGFPVPTGEATVTCAALSADGRTAAVGDERGRVTLWRMEPGRPPVHAGTLEHGGFPVEALTFSLSGGMLAVSEYYAHVSVWDVPKAKRLARLGLGENSPYANFATPAEAAFSPDGEAIALGWQPPVNALQIYRLPSGKPVGDPADLDGVAAFRFTANSARVFAVDYAGNRHLLHQDTGAIDKRPTTPSGTPPNGHTVLGPGLLKDARYLRMLSAGGTELRQMEDGARVCPPWPELDTDRAAFSPDGRRLATVHGSGVRVWDAGIGVALRPPIESPAGVTAVGWSSDGERLAIGDAAGTVTVWRIDPGTMGQVPAHRRLGVPLRLDGRVTDIHLHPSAPWLLAAAVGEVRWWSWDGLNAADGGFGPERLARGPGGRLARRAGRGLEIVGPDGKVVPLAGGPAGAVGFLSADRLAGMDEAGRLLLWDAADGKLLAEAKTPELAFRAFAVSPEAGELAAADKETRAVRRWAVRGDRFEPLPVAPQAEREQVRGLAYAGGRLVAFSDRVEVLADDGRPVATVPVREYVSAWAAAPDGRTVAAAGDRTSPVLIDARDGRVVRELACEVTVRELAFSPDGTVLAGVTEAEFRGRPPVVRRWWVATGSRLPDLPVPADGSYGLRYDPDGRLVFGRWGWPPPPPVPADRAGWLTAVTGLARGPDDRLRRAGP